MTLKEQIEAKIMKAEWASVGLEDPFEHYDSGDDVVWEFLYMTERCTDVLKTRFLSMDCDNEDANEVLNLLSRFWRETLIGDYLKRNDIREAFNRWWWENHDIEDYKEYEA